MRTFQIKKVFNGGRHSDVDGGQHISSKPSQDTLRDNGKQERFTGFCVSGQTMKSFGSVPSLVFRGPEKTGIQEGSVKYAKNVCEKIQLKIAMISSEKQNDVIPNTAQKVSIQQSRDSSKKMKQKLRLQPLESSVSVKVMAVFDSSYQINSCDKEILKKEEKHIVRNSSLQYSKKLAQVQLSPLKAAKPVAIDKFQTRKLETFKSRMGNSCLELLQEFVRTINELEIISGDVEAISDICQNLSLAKRMVCDFLDESLDPSSQKSSAEFTSIYRDVAESCVADAVSSILFSSTYSYISQKLALLKHALLQF